MPLRIITYPHPTLRRKALPLRRVDAELRGMVAEMFELMYKHKGCGLAATQVDLPYRLFIVNESGDPGLKDEEFVILNPVLSKHKGSEEDEEGCLSLPGLYAQVRRPAQVSLEAFDLAGKPIRLEAKGRFARVLQHENDHLDGVLFIDRLSPTQLLASKDQIAEFETEFAQRRERGEIPGDAQIAARIAELEAQRS
ncbi:MAG: peptide deformylase [Planctomycetes bacterium]|nr:peptide deformylase [Planctomycetota bacterium]